MAKNTIQYIIDHPGYGDQFIVTSTTNGFQNYVEKDTIYAYVGSFNCFFTSRADVVFNAVTQVEVA